jgi:hypothetical protein
VPEFDSRRKIQPQKAPGEIFVAADADSPPKTVSAPDGVERDGPKPPLFGAKIDDVQSKNTNFINNLDDG